MKKWAFLIAFGLVLVGFQGKAAHAQVACGSYGLAAGEQCVPSGEDMCQEWVYDSNGDPVPGTEQCVPSVPVGGVQRYTSDIGQDCEQPVDPSGSPDGPVTCTWPTVTKSLGSGCSEQIYTAGPDEGLPGPGPAFCPNMTPDGTRLKTWTEP